MIVRLTASDGPAAQAMVFAPSGWSSADPMRKANAPTNRGCGCRQRNVDDLASGGQDVTGGHRKREVAEKVHRHHGALDGGRGPVEQATGHLRS